MTKEINDLEKGLKDQLTSLANDIRNTEEALIRTKEGYLKVQGALEILGILKQQVTSEENKQLTSAEALTSIPID